MRHRRSRLQSVPRLRRRLGDTAGRAVPPKRAWWEAMTTSASVWVSQYKVPRPHDLLEAGEGRLRSQGRRHNRVAPYEELVDRVVFEAGGIVAIHVAAGQPEAAVPDERGEIVRDLPRLASPGEAVRQPGGQAGLVVGCLEQDRAAIGALVRGIESSEEGLGKEVREQHRFHTLFGHRCASSVTGCVRVHSA